MEDFSKITKVLEALGYGKEHDLRFTLHRFERLDSAHIKFKEKDRKKILEVFEKFHFRHAVKVKEGEFPSSVGVLPFNRFIEFLEEYDEKFDLNWCEIDLKEVVLKPIYL
jgi:hypothetical protein